MSSLARTTYHHGQLRPALLKEARALLDAGGPEAISLREIARRSGVSPTAAYRHFRDKDSLLAAIAVEGFLKFSAALRASMAGGKPFASMGRAYIEFALAQPGLFRLMFGPLIRERERFPELAVASAKAFEALRGGASTTLASPEADIDAAALRAWALVHGLAHLLLDGVFDRASAGEMIDAALRAR